MGKTWKRQKNKEKKYHYLKLLLGTKLFCVCLMLFLSLCLRMSVCMHMYDKTHLKVAKKIFPDLRVREVFIISLKQKEETI